MESKFWQTVERLAAVLVIVAVLAGGAWAGIRQFSDPEVAQGDGYATACYREQGGSKWVCGSGGEMEFQSGAILDVQAGATVNLPSTTAGNTIITGTLAVSGTTDLVGAVSSSTGGVSVTDALIVGVDGTSYNVTLYSDTAGDYLLWDQANEALTIIGTNGQDALNVDDGNVDIADNIDVDGTASVTGVLDAKGAIINSTGYVTINDHLDVANTLNYSAANLWPVGAEDSNFQWSWGGQVITGSAAVSNQKVASPTYAWCTIAGTPVNATGNVCTTIIVGNVVTVSVWLSNSVASAAGVTVNWLVIGIP